MTTNSHYWLARWIDECEIRNAEDIEHCLNAHTTAQKLVESIVSECKAAPRSSPEVQVQNGAVAGRRVDLSGVMGCQAYECQRKIIDASFGSIFHYFDSIVVEGLSSYRALSMARQNAELFVHSIYQHARTFLYLREIGAEPFLIFTEKPDFCEQHFNENADELHVFSPFEKADKAKLVGLILRTSTFDIKQTELGWHFTVDSPLFQEPVTTYIEGGKKPTKKSIAEDVARLYSFALVTDVFTSRLFRLPLADSGAAAWLAKEDRQNRLTEADVALHLELPVLDRLDLRTFLKLREDEREAFESFRVALSAAISNQLSKDGAADQTADAVVKQFVAPGLAEIERKATSSRRLLTKKGTLDFSVGTAAAVIGLTESIPLVLTVSAAAIAAALGVVHANINERETIRLSDCYFLWRAKKAAGSQH